MKKILICTLVALLLITSAALAAPGDVTLYTNTTGEYQTRRLSDIAVVGDTIYAICEDNTLIALQAGEVEPKEYTMGDADDIYLYYTRLFSWGERLMLLDRNTGKLYEITLGEDQAQLHETLQLQLVERQGQKNGGESAYVDYLVNPWVEGNTLYAYVDDQERVALMAYDLTDGTGRVITDQCPAQWLTPGRAGEALYTTPDPDNWRAPAVLHALSLEDGSSKALVKLMTNWLYGLTYDAAHERVIYISDQIIYATALDGTQEELGTVPMTDMMSGSAYCVAAGDYFVIGDALNGLIVRNLDPRYRATRSLTIRTYSLDIDEAYMAFTSSHPDVMVKPMTGGDVTSEEVTQAMLSGASDADIYALRVDHDAFGAMVNRGFVADLSKSEILQSAVARMYPQFAEVLMKDGKLIAFPVSEGGYTLSWNEKLGAEMGIAPPTTWDELLDLVALGRGFLRELPRKDALRPTGYRSDQAGAHRHVV